MQNWSTIADVVEEGQDSQTDDISTSSRESVVNLLCPWADRYNVILDIVGTNRLWAYENAANDFAMRAYSCSMRPFGTTGDTVAGFDQLMVYEKARLTVRYQPMQLSTTGGSPYTAYSETIVPSIDWLRVDHEQFVWDDGPVIRTPVKRDEANGIKKHRLVIQRTFFNWDLAIAPVPAAYLTAQGTTNDAAATSAILGLTFAPQTLAFSPGQIAQTISSDGTRRLNVTVGFEFKEEEWNKWPKGNQYLNQRFIGNGADEIYEPYTPTDYTGLLG